MGSKSKSRESTKSTAFNFNNVDYGGGGGSGPKNLNLGLVDSSIDSLEITDGGAVQAMLQATLGNQDLAKGFIDGSQSLSNKAFDTASKVAKDNQEFLKDISSDQHDLYSSLTSNLTNYADKQASQAAKATDKALDYVYSASQSETAALTEDVSKWMIGAAVAVVVLGFFAIMAMKGAD